MKSLCQTAMNVAFATASLFAAGCAVMPEQMAYEDRLGNADAIMSCAKVQEGRGNLNEAKRLYGEASRANPQNAVAYHRLGVIATRLNQHREAEAYYRKAYSLNASNPALLADMGYSAFQRRDFEMAEAYLEQSVRMNGHDSRTIDNLAIARAWCGKDDSALAAFRAIHGDAEANRRLNAIQLARGDVKPIRETIKDQAVENIATTLPPVPPSIEVPDDKRFAGVPKSLAKVDASPLDPALSFVPPSPEPLAEPAAFVAEASVSLPDVEFGTTETATFEMPVALPVPLPAPAADLPVLLPVPTNREPKVEVVKVAEPVEPVELPAPSAPTLPSLAVDANPVALVSNKETRFSPRKRVETADRVEPPRRFVSVEQEERASEDRAEAFAAAVKQKAKVFEAEAAKMLETIEWETEDFAETRPARFESAGQSRIDDEKPRIVSMTESKPAPLTNWHKTPSSRRTAPQQTPSPAPRNEVDVTASTTEVATEVGDESKPVWGVCLVTLTEENRLERGLPEHCAEYQSQRFRFSSADAMKKFLASPKRYVPAAGGLDVVAVRNEQSAIQGTINFAISYRGQLYLFASRENAEAFCEKPSRYVSQALGGEEKTNHAAAMPPRK